MANGFAGFQTQLSETFNKQRDAGDNLLEAFLDENGRLAFRFVDESGNVVSQPRVTTPGFVRPTALGITPPTLPSPVTAGGLASPTASGGLISDPGGGAPGGVGPGGSGDTSGTGTGGFGLAGTGVTSPESAIAGRIARGVTPFGNVGTKAAKALGSLLGRRPGVVEGPIKGMRTAPTLSEAQDLADIAVDLGFGQPLSGLDQAVQSNDQSIADLDNTSASGTSTSTPGKGGLGQQSGPRGSRGSQGQEGTGAEGEGAAGGGGPGDPPGAGDAGAPGGAPGAPGEGPGSDAAGGPGSL